MNARKIVIGAAVIVVGLPVVAVPIAGASYYAVMSLYAPNRTNGTRFRDARFVPPPPNRVPEAMGALEEFLHDAKAPPPLLKAALWHVQFETIHALLDGSGRVGRLIVTLLLCAEGMLREPMLYLSPYLKQHRRRYYELLDSVRRDGDWEAWVAFSCQGVATVSESAVAAARRLLALAEGDRDRLQLLGRRAGSAAAVHQALLRTPLSTIPRLAKRTGLHPSDDSKGAGRPGGTEDRERNHRQEAESRVPV
jgi:Fic family protein